MMLQLSDDGVVSSVNEENLIYVDKNELEQFIESYQELEKENEQLKKDLKTTKDGEELYIKLSGGLEEENKHLKQQMRILYDDIYFLKRFIEKKGFRAELVCDKGNDMSDRICEEWEEL